MNRIISFLCVALSISATVFAESMVNPFPAGKIFPQPVGILFPSLGTAGGVNASSIPVNNRGTAIHAAVSPSLSSGVDPLQYFGSISSTGGSLGLSAGGFGSSLNGASGYGAFGGMGYSFDAFSLGLGIRDNDVKTSWNPSVDASLMLLQLKDFIAGAVLYDLNYNTQLDVGIGVKSGKRYNVEANLLLPPFNNMGAGYTATVSAAIFVEPVGVHFRSSFYTWNKSFSHTVGAGIWLSKFVHFIAQFTTTRTATAGLTVLF